MASQTRTFLQAGIACWISGRKQLAPMRSKKRRIGAELAICCRSNEIPNGCKTKRRWRLRYWVTGWMWNASKRPTFSTQIGRCTKRTIVKHHFPAISTNFNQFQESFEPNLDGNRRPTAVKIGLPIWAKFGRSQRRANWTCGWTRDDGHRIRTLNATKLRKKS